MKREEEPRRYQTFEDLDVYCVAREFRKAMYSVTKRLPEFEKFALADQIRRAAVSVTNNIAEGHGRFHFLEQIKFVLQARGSLEELMDDLNVCEDEKFISPAEIDSLKNHAWRVHKLINGYIRFLRTQRAATTNRVQELDAENELRDFNVEDDAAESRFNASSLQRFNE